MAGVLPGILLFLLRGYDGNLPLTALLRQSSRFVVVDRS